MDWRSKAEAIFNKHGYSQVRPFMTVDFGRVQSVEAVSVIALEAESHALITRIRADLPAYLVAFIGTTRWLGKQKEKGVEIVIGQASNQFDIVRLAQTDAANYDMMNEDIISKLQAYDDQYGIDVLAAETEGLTFRLKRKLDDSERRGFATDFAEFCPDIVGYYGEDDFAELLISTREIICWWD